MFLKVFKSQPALSVNLFKKSGMKEISRLTQVLILSTSFGLYVSNTQAADVSCTWTGGVLEAGKWSDPSWNSDPGCSGTFPNNNGTTFDATLRTGIPGVNLDQNIEIETFNFNGGTLNGANNLTVNQVFNWARGDLSGTGIVDAQGGLELSDGRKVIANEQTLINSQTANWTGGSIDLFNTSQLLNQSDATFNVTAGGLRIFGSSTAQFINDGNLVVNLSDLSENVQFDGPRFNNNGTVNVEKGIARFGGGGTSTGSFTVAANGQLNFSGGTHTLLPTSSVTGANVEFSFKDSGGSTTIEGIYNVDNTIISGNAAIFNAATSVTGTLTQTGGFLQGVGDVIVTGKTTLSGGVIESIRPDDQPQAVLAAVGGLEINGSFLTVVGNRRLLNTGVANWTSGGIGLNNTLTRFENAPGATFNIKENATRIQGQGTLLGGTGEKGLFVNQGDVVIDLSANRPPVLIDTGFANLGRVDLQGDRFELGDFLIQFGSGSLLFDIGGASAGEFDVLNVTGSAALDGTIDITLTNLFIPDIGTTFDILIAGAITGFQTVEGFSLGGKDGSRFDFEIADLASGNQALRLTFAETVGVLAPVPIPASIWLFMSALVGMWRFRFKKS
ncbi:MAG: hypothetical protein V3U88_10140 [Methylococcales bacterium]